MNIRSYKDFKLFNQTSWQTHCPDDSSYGLFERNAQQFESHPALSFQFSSDVDAQVFSWSYRALFSKITQTANAFHQVGVENTGVISYLLPNLPQTLFTLWGAQAIGIAGPINTMLEPEAIKDILVESESQAVVVLGPDEQSNIWDKFIAIADHVHSLKAIFYVPQQNASSSPIANTLGGIPIFHFDQYIQQCNKDALDFQRHTRPTDIAAYFHTGGTTGSPKLAGITHQNQMFVSGVSSSLFHYDHETVSLCGLPLFHVNAVFATGLNVWQRGGHAVFLTPGGFRTPGLLNNLWALIEKYQATFFSAVPTIVSSLLAQITDSTKPSSSLKYIVCGAAPISAQTLNEFMDKTGVRVIEGYGMTEATCVSSVNPLDGELRPGSIGFPLPYQQMKCVKIDDSGAFLGDCDVDEVGEIVIKGPNVFAGYKDTTKNQRIFHQGWLLTGDLGRQDREGYFWLVGRAKDLIIRSGHNIDPKVIEDALSRHPDVELAAAIGQPDAYAGELPCAYLTMKKHTQVDTESIRRFAQQQITERAAVPVYFEVVKTMPLTGVGKIFKPELRALATERVLKDALAEAGFDAQISVVSDTKLGFKALIQTDKDYFSASKVLKQFTVAYEFIAQR